MGDEFFIAQAEHIVCAGPKLYDRVTINLAVEYLDMVHEGVYGSERDERENSLVQDIERQV